MNRKTRFLAWVLAFVLCAGTISFNAFASESIQDQESSETEAFILENTEDSDFSIPDLLEVPETEAEEKTTAESPVEIPTETTEEADIILPAFEGDESSGAIVLGVDIGIKIGDIMDFKDENGGDTGKEHYYQGIYLAASECFGFARWCQYKIFGEISAGNYDESYTENSTKRYYHVSIPDLNADTLKDAITKAGPGTHIRTGGSAHSMFVTDVTEDGFSIIQCNGYNNQEYSDYVHNKVGTYTYTWNSYITGHYGGRGIAYLEVPYKKYASCLEAPEDGEQISNDVMFTGWAVHQNSVNEVYGYVNGIRYTAEQYSRPDVQEAYPGYPVQNEGFRFSVSRKDLSEGENTYQVIAKTAGDWEWVIAEGTIINPVIEIKGTTYTLAEGETRTLSARIVGKESNAVWKSNNKSIAKVNSKGVVTAVKEGTCTVLASANGETDSVIIKVIKPSVTLNKTSLTLVKGEKAKLKAKIRGKSQIATWKSSNTDRATVSNGVVKGVGTGKVKITASANGVKDVCTVTVVNPTLTLNKSAVSVEKGKTVKLKATINGTGSVTWSSSDTAIATVSDGIVKGITPGKVKITAKYHNIKKTCTVTVAILKLDKSSLEIQEGSSKQLKATVKGPSTTVKWSSSKTVIAIVDNGKITAKKPGTCTITVKANGLTKKCTVTVLPAKWKEAYAEFLKKYTSYYNPSFHLSYMTNDSTPELVLTMGNFHASTPTVYTYTGGEVKEICSYGSYGTIYYARKKGVLAVYNMSFGHSTAAFYQIDKKFNLKTIKIFTDNENTEDSVKTYNIDGSKVSKKEYNAELKAIQDKYTFLTAGAEKGYKLNTENINKILTDYKSLFDK